MNPALLNGKSPGADGTVSETGWSNHAVFRQYLMKHFIKFIPGRDNEKVLLILDCHKSHVSVDLCEWLGIMALFSFFCPLIQAMFCSHLMCHVMAPLNGCSTMSATS